MRIFSSIDRHHMRKKLDLLLEKPTLLGVQSKMGTIYSSKYFLHVVQVFYKSSSHQAWHCQDKTSILVKAAKHNFHQSFKCDRGALQHLKGITLNWYNPFLIEKAVFPFSCSSMAAFHYSLFKSKVEIMVVDSGKWIPVLPGHVIQFPVIHTKSAWSSLHFLLLGYW